MTCTGDYAQSSGGTLHIELGGPSPVSQHDVLIVSGAASVAGTFDLAIFGAYDPPIGAQFDVVTASSVTGTFTTIHPSGLAAGKAFEVTYPPGKVRVTVVPRAVPMAGWQFLAALTLMLAAVGAWAASRRAAQRLAAYARMRHPGPTMLGRGPRIDTCRSTWTGRGSSRRERARSGSRRSSSLPPRFLSPPEPHLPALARHDVATRPGRR